MGDKLIPKNKHQLAVMLYKQTVKELQNDPDEWLSFLKFVAKVHKYSFRDQILLFANSPDAELVADFDQWNGLGRRIKKGQKSIQIFDTKGNRTKNVFDVSQTWGKDFKVFNWDLNDHDKENLLEHWKEKVTDFPPLEGIESLDFKLHLTITRVLDSKVPDGSYIHNCAEYIVLERLGLPTFSVYENVARHTLAGNNFDELMTSIYQPAKEVLLEIEKTLEKKYEKERVSYNERIKRTIGEPTLPDVPNWADVSSRGDSLQSQAGRAGRGFEPTRNGRTNASNEVGRRKSNSSRAAKVRGDVLHESEREGSEDFGSDRQPLHEAVGREPSTRNGDGENSALSDITSTSQGNNLGRIQLNNDSESVAPKASDFSFGGRSSSRQQLSLFGEVESIETKADPIVDIDVIQGEAQSETDDLPFDIDEIIDKELLRGSGFQNGKYRIYNQYQYNISRRERAQFLKEEHGTGGRTSDNGIYVEKSPKGYALRLMGNYTSDGEWRDIVRLSWSKVDKRIEKLIEDGRYLDDSELLKYQELYPDEDIEVENSDKTFDGSELVQVEEEAPLSLFDFDETQDSQDEVPDVTTVIHELVEVDEALVLDHEVESEFLVEDEAEPASNFKFPTGGDFYARTKREKFTSNIDAILLLKELEETGRRVDEKDQHVLAHYVGWGGLSEAFDSHNEDWREEYVKLKEVLSTSEYKAALDSVLTAYYTDPRLVAEIYHVAEYLGMKPKNILDPAMGTGNFFSKLPDSMEEAKLYGVELDSITGRIAQKLYPDATIAIKGYEEMPFPDSTFDLVVGNIPFGDIPLNDGRYGDQKFLIHDYFMAKSIDVVKDNGVVAFVTSKGTLDKKDSQVRRYLAERADLVGAVRLPNNAFKDIAGTSVTSDVLFFQKRAELRDLTTDLPNWVHTQPFQDSKVAINQYFLDNPDHVLGELEFSGIYGPQSALVCKPRVNQDLYKDFRKAFIDEESQNIDDLFKAIETTDEIVPDGTRNNTYFVHKDKLYYKTINNAQETTLKPTTTQRLKSMCAVRHHLMQVINIQLEADYDVAEFEKALSDLNQSYDQFVDKYGYFNDKFNRREFANDDQLPLLLSIEKKSKEDKTISKGDIFYKPTIRPNKIVTRVETAHDALILSLSRKLTVNLDFMESVSDFSKDELIEELDGLIFQDPTLFEGEYSGWLHRDEYLSGDVKQKLEAAVKFGETYRDIDFSKNIAALEGVIPKPLQASEIQFQLGSTWIPVSTYQDFMHETFETSNYHLDTITVEHCKYANKWRINDKNGEWGNVKVNSTYGTGRINAYEILEKTLNLGQINIKDKIIEDGQEKWFLNVEETMIARAKQDQIKQRFSTWLFEDPTRASQLISLYNEKFNRFVPRNYDGSHLEFPNLSTEWKLRKHQEDVAARILYNRSALMAHEVGAGKTASMIVAGMSLKQVGAIHKALYVVPSHLTEQFANEFLSMYPTANVLMTTKKDFEKKNRHQFVSKIATNEYDAVIIGHSQFEKIPLSPEREQEFLQGQLDDIIEAIENTTADEKSWSVKSMVRFRRSLENKISDLRDQERKDNVINFEQLGVDFMFVDEAHVYKNLLTITKLENVAGISTSSSQRAMDMFAKCRYIQGQNNGGGIVFSTGTPISNSMSELYTMQRFLQREALNAMGLVTFDDWASTFGEITSSLEMTPEGSGYRIRNRFAKFHNLSELMSTFQIVADIRTHDMLDLERPDLYGGKAQIIVSEPSPYQQNMMTELAHRAERIRLGNVDPRLDNMLKITHEAKLMAIDPRLIDPDAEIDEGSKIFQCASSIYQIWQETAENKSTQIIFSDSGTPKKGQFNVYDEVKNQLMRKGIPEHEIAFIHDPKTDLQREQLFDKVRSGEVRVLLGSTSKLGTGTNVQDKLIAGHHLDCPWRPSDLVQRDGRVVRQGNENKVVHMFRYVTKGTFDSYLWQIQEQKLKYISQVMTGKSISRSCSDLDETVLSAAEVKAIATSNPLLSEKMTLDNEVARLQLVKSSWVNERVNLQEKIQTGYPNRIEKLEKDIEIRQSEMTTLNAFPLQKDEKGKEIFSIQLNNKSYDNRNEAFETLTALINPKRMAKNERTIIGEYRGLKLSAEINNFIDAQIYVNDRYATNFSDLSGIGNLTRMQNKVNDLPKELQQKVLELEDNRKNLTVAKQEITKPFEQEEKLLELLNRQSEINRKIEFGMTDDESPIETSEVMDDEPLLDDFTPPQGAIGIEKEEKGAVRTKITTWQRENPDERQQWLIQEGYLSEKELDSVSLNDEYVEVENDQFIPNHLVRLEDAPTREVNQQDYQELA